MQAAGRLGTQENAELNCGSWEHISFYRQFENLSFLEIGYLIDELEQANAQTWIKH